MTREQQFFERIAVECRVLGFCRMIVDELYFGLAMVVPMSFQIKTGWLIGARGYFDWRDSIDFPAIGRFASRRFYRWQRKNGYR